MGQQRPTAGGPGASRPASEAARFGGSGDAVCAETVAGDYSRAPHVHSGVDGQPTLASVTALVGLWAIAPLLTCALIGFWGSREPSLHRLVGTVGTLAMVVAWYCTHVFGVPSLLLASGPGFKFFVPAFVLPCSYLVAAMPGVRNAPWAFVGTGAATFALLAFVPGRISESLGMAPVYLALHGPPAAALCTLAASAWRARRSAG
jgi:hypothetical protein